MREDLDFLNIYEEFYLKIIHYLSRMFGVKDADDVTQEVFDKISRNLDVFGENQRFPPGFTKLLITPLWIN